MTDRFHITLLIVIVFNTALLSQTVNQSVLSDGNIYKFSIPQSGIYKISHSFLSESLNIDLSLIDPRNIHIYSNNGGFVPQLINDSRIDDLNELDILVSGEEDGTFNTEDYILLYAEGADKYNLKSNDLVFEKNIYDFNNYLFLKIENSPGKRIQSRESIQAEFYSSIKETAIRHEDDRLNLLGAFSGTQGSGKQWFGESFTNERDQNFDKNFSFPNLVQGTMADIKILLSSRSSSSASFDITIDGTPFQTTHPGTNTGDIESLYSESQILKDRSSLNSTDPSINISYKPVASNSEAWLDYIEIIAEEYITYTENSNFIFHRNSLEYSSYGFQFDATQNLNIWDITDISRVQSINYQNNGQNVEFGYESSHGLSAFLAFNPDNEFPSPTFIEQIENQNLHSIQRADYAIVYHPDFQTAAEQLAQHRRDYDGLVVETINIFHVYNEFGGGKKDPSALRDFAKMLLDRDPEFRYLLLFGDATYDFRGIQDFIPYHNFVPTYQTLQSLNPIEAFPSDDFFALLTANEGDESLDGALDIGVGRIPVSKLDDGLNFVNKIIHYDTHPDMHGDWKMRIGFAADDQDKPVDKVHVIQSNGIAKLTELNHPEFNQQKVFFDAYTQESTPGGQRYPDANAAINDNIIKGQLATSYLGHGGPKGWAQERVLQIGDILNWDNFNRMPIIITATCSFTGFDEPTFVSAGEHALLNGSGGAIALFTTVRAVYSSSNKRLTEEVYKKIFTRNEGQRLRLGDIIKESQNANSADTTKSNSRKFMLIGDPALTIGSPKYNIKVDQLNGQTITAQQVDTLGALERASISGSIVDYSDNIISSFNGEIFLTVFDKNANRKTLDNDNQGSTYDFEIRNSVLYKGSATVSNGQFEIEFIIPKDINFDYGNGHLSLYASDGQSDDAGGYYNQIVIGGIGGNGITDTEGPEIDIFFDTRSFQFGGRTSLEPLLILDLEDENGINLSATSIGHDITASIDDKNGTQIILNDFYNPEVDQIGKGTVEYQLKDLEPGMHTIYIKAWDILNNSSEAISEFFIADEDDGKLRNVYNYPNPFSTNTNFTFEHDLTNANLDVLVNIYTLSGKLVKSIQEQKFSPGSRINDINWDGRDDFGSKLAKGVYIYKIKLSASEFNLHRDSDFQKLVVLN